MNMENQIQERAKRLQREGETIGQTINRVLGDRLDEENLSQSEEIAKAQEALRDPDKSLGSSGIDFEGL